MDLAAGWPPSTPERSCPSRQSSEQAHLPLPLKPPKNTDQQSFTKNGYGKESFSDLGLVLDLRKETDEKQ